MTDNTPIRVLLPGSHLKPRLRALLLDSDTGSAAAGINSRPALATAPLDISAAPDARQPQAGQDGPAEVILLDCGSEVSPDEITQIHQRMPHLPLVVLGEATDAGTARAVVLAGADEYLAWPNLDQDALLRALHQALARRQVNQAYRLELQSAEGERRREAEAALRQARDELAQRVQERTEALVKHQTLLQKVLELLPVGIWLMDANGALIHSNSEGQRIWGGAPQTGIEGGRLFKGWRLPGREPIAGDQWSGARAIHQQATTLNELIEIETFNGERKIIISSALPYYDENQTLLGAIITNLDVTERMRAEQALRESEQTLRAIFENSPDLIFLLSRDGSILRVNRGLHPYTIEDTLGANLFGFITEEGAARLRQAFDEAAANGVAAGFEYTARNGQSWHVRVVLLQSGGQDPQFFVLGTDITEQKRITAELLEVRRRLDESREAERLYLAQELHDLPMQELYSAQLLLAQLKLLLDEPQTRTLVEGIGAALVRANRLLRDLCNELRPPALERFGLSAALRSHLNQLQSQYPDLALQLDLPVDDLRLGQQEGLALYRICQQALSNVVQHAGASEAQVRLAVEDGRLILEIRDNGRGFVVPERWVDLTRANHLGLAGSAERAEAIGADYQVVSAPGAGATVRVMLSLSH